MSLGLGHEEPAHEEPASKEPASGDTPDGGDGGDGGDGAGTTMDDWPVERLRAEAWAAAVGDRPVLERIRLVAQSHAYHDLDQPGEVRRQWAGVALLANRRMRNGERVSPTADLQLDFMLRTWGIDRFGAQDDCPDWNPGILASDTLDALAYSPSEARDLAGDWRRLPADRIRELRRHKNLTGHLDVLVRHLPAGPVREQLLRWVEAREQLP